MGFRSSSKPATLVASYRLIVAAIGMASEDHSRPSFLKPSSQGTMVRINSAIRVASTAVDSRPIPAAMPMAAVTQIPATVVSPWVSVCRVPRMMVPAPRNPTPAVRPCKTRVRSAVDAPACWGIRTKRAAPILTSIWVRIPALFPFYSRS